MAWSGARRVAVIVSASSLLFFALLFVLALSQRRAAELRIRDWIVHVLEQKFQSSVELTDFRVRVFPRMNVSGSGLALHYWAAPDAPPLIRVENFSFDLGFRDLFQVPRRINRIRLKRMVITIPPRKIRRIPRPPLEDTLSIPLLVVGAIESENSELIVLSDKAGVEPLDWEIHNLVLREAGVSKSFEFQGTLTNAKPKGEIATTGEFGPWKGDDPGATPVSGKYAFADADLGPFPGIAGILSSTGTYSGQLDELEVNGETDTPDFSLDNAGKPVPLHTDFSATVDGTNGDTILHPVHAVLGKSELIANGSVLSVPAQKGHRIVLDVTSPNARIEDMLRLAINSDRPFLGGPVRIDAKLSIPPGTEKVIDKMALDANFDLLNGNWTSSNMREKLENLSRHAEGKPQDEDAGSSVTDLTGRFVLKNSTITFSKLSFSVPGANVQLAGTYGIHTQDINMRGHLKMQAKLSQTVSGVKSFFLKAIDPFFSKNGAGAELPISITGPRDSPVFSVSIFHKKIEKPMSKTGTP